LGPVLAVHIKILYFLPTNDVPFSFYAKGTFKVTGLMSQNELKKLQNLRNEWNSITFKKKSCCTCFIKITWGTKLKQAFPRVSKRSFRVEIFEPQLS